MPNSTLLVVEHTGGVDPVYMMTLKDRLTGDLKNALKAGAGDRPQVLRFLLAQLNNREIEKRGSGKDPTLTDEEAIQVFQKEAKKRKEAIELFKRGGRSDLAEKEEAELRIVEEYVPQQLSKEEISKIIGDLLAGGTEDFNLLMKETMKQVGGRADGRTVSELVRKKLG